MASRIHFRATSPWARLGIEAPVRVRMEVGSARTWEEAMSMTRFAFFSTRTRLGTEAPVRVRAWGWGLEGREEEMWRASCRVQFLSTSCRTSSRD